MFSYGFQRGQTENDISELPKVYDQNILKIGDLLRQYFLQNSEVATGHLGWFIDAENAEDRRGDIS